MPLGAQIIGKSSGHDGGSTEIPFILDQQCITGAVSLCQEALRDYKINCLNLFHNDLYEHTFPDADFSLFAVSSVRIKTEGDRTLWPDPKGRYFWEIKLDDGRIIGDFCWMQDNQRGWPDKANRYWFKIVGCTNAYVMLDGFSVVHTSDDYYIEYNPPERIEKIWENFSSILNYPVSLNSSTGADIQHIDNNAKAISRAIYLTKLSLANLMDRDINESLNTLNSLENHLLLANDSLENYHERERLVGVADLVAGYIAAIVRVELEADPAISRFATHALFLIYWLEICKIPPCLIGTAILASFLIGIYIGAVLLTVFTKAIENLGMSEKSTLTVGVIGYLFTVLLVAPVCISISIYFATRLIDKLLSNSMIGNYGERNEHNDPEQYLNNALADAKTLMDYGRTLFFNKRHMNTRIEMIDEEEILRGQTPPHMKDYGYNL